MRVLFYQDNFGLGGIERFIVDCAIRLNRMGVEADLACSRKETKFFDDELASEGIIVKQILDDPAKGTPRRYLQGYAALRRHLKTNREYDFVHINANHGLDYIFSHAARSVSGSQVVFHSHNGGMDKSAVKYAVHYICRFLLGGRNILRIACSKRAAKWLFGSSKEYKLISNGIACDRFSFDRSARMRIRRELQVGKDDLILGHIGRFNEQKNHRYLLDVFEAVQRKKPCARLMLAGEGELEDEIRREVVKRDLSDSVFFLGPRHDVGALLSAMDVFLFPSLFEGLGIAVVEAQAASLPVVCSDAVPLEACLSERIVFLPLSDIEEWAKAVLAMSEYPREREIPKSISESGYSIDRSAYCLARFYEKKLREPSA